MATESGEGSREDLHEHQDCGSDARRPGLAGFIADFHNKTILFRAGRVVFVTYGLVNAIAFVLATLAALTYTRMLGRDPMDMLVGSVFAVLPGVLIGARLFSILLEWRQLFTAPRATILKPGYMLHGGVFGGIAGMFAYNLVTGVPVLHMLDTWGFAMPLGEAVARIGCHVYGCCWGKPTKGRIAIRYSSPHAKVVRMAPHLRGKPIYPAQLLGCITHLAQFGLIFALVPHLEHAGMVAAVYFGTHAVARVILERFRQDDRGKLIGPLTHTNLYSAIQLAIAVALFAYCGSLPAITPAEYASPIGVVVAQPGALGLVMVIFFVAAGAFGVHIDKVGVWISPAEGDEGHAGVMDPSLEKVEAR